jgi:hypothetical protein
MAPILDNRLRENADLILILDINTTAIAYPRHDKRQYNWPMLVPRSRRSWKPGRWLLVVHVVLGGADPPLFGTISCRCV